MMKLNLNYYDINAVEFFESTFQIDMESLYQSFLRYLPDNALILDLGCVNRTGFIGDFFI